MLVGGIDEGIVGASGYTAVFCCGKGLIDEVKVRASRHTRTISIKCIIASLTVL